MLWFYTVKYCTVLLHKNVLYSVVMVSVRCVT